MIERLEVETRGKGLYDVTPRIAAVVERSGLSEGLCTVMIQHTSASLTIQENYDPTARCDLEGWIERLVPEDDPHFTHKVEGPDDMPSHVKAALTSTTLSIPVLDGKLALGTWQGLFLWEHRTIGRVRSLVLHLGP
ncbi:MAG TPA: secondary thiamine-phosphate synthase enzyme YjbQ [Thermoanaerobaculia bacterium]|nr:secondary thiamine-phosphate synthase enzyme YjbQ [Thermoanaerobaculia bacterium]